MSWADIKYKMPPDDDTKRLYAVIDKDDTRGADVVRWCSIKESFVDTYYGEVYEYEDLTHWMPLPEPPQ